MYILVYLKDSNAPAFLQIFPSLEEVLADVQHLDLRMLTQRFSKHLVSILGRSDV